MWIVAGLTIAIFFVALSAVLNEEDDGWISDPEEIETFFGLLADRHQKMEDGEV